jgi:glycosyltransferase involved in cell wall biosynthesis
MIALYHFKSSAMKKKVVFLIRDLNYGGAQRQLVTLVKGLKEYFDVTLLYFYPGGALEKDLHGSGVRSICLEKQQRWDVFGFFWRLLQYLRQIQPDVLHGYLGESNLVATFVKPFFTSTRIVWGIRESNTDPNLYGWLGRFISQITPILSRFADLMIINSYAGRTYYTTQGYPTKKMVVILNGIDVERFHPDPKAGAKVRKEWGISSEMILIGLVGRLAPMKDHPTFLRAVALMCKERQDVHFVCVGIGPENYAQELYRLTNELDICDRVIWAGARTDMPAVNNALDIACSSSSHGEGFPNVIGEAMACGVTCVVTDNGDSKLIVGDTGMVIPPSNPQALFLSWLQILSSDRQQLSIMARQRIMDNYTTQKLYETTETVLSKIIDGSELLDA